MSISRNQPIRSAGDAQARLFLLWAKIGHGKNDSFATRHPLICHCIDVGKSAALLWTSVLRESVKGRLAAALGVGEDTPSAGRWVAFWAAAHDLGKASPGFQCKRKEAVVEPLSSAGFDFTRCDDHPHQFVGANVLAKELGVARPDRPAVDLELARRVAIAVGGHHGLFPLTAEWNDLPLSKLGCGVAWEEAQCALLGELAHVFGVADGTVPSNPTGPNAHWPMMLLAGLVSVADWIGSNKMFFPHEPATEDARAYATIAAQRALRALTDLGWLKWSLANSGARTFSELFPFPPRPLQEAAVHAADGISGPALVLIEAPMGEGKTEAALYLADHWTHRMGGQGLYVAMPTMATGNQMFSRVSQFLSKRYPGDVVNLQLLHSAAMLSEEFTAMQRQGFKPSEVYDSGATRTPSSEGSSTTGAIVAESWFAQNKKQAILAPFGVGTVDQALLSVLQVRHGFVRLFGLAGKTVILDEIHAYDAYMSALLERLLEWLCSLGCSVVLLSATLPGEKRRALLKAWTGSDPPIGQTPYPRLSVGTDGSVTVRTFVTDSARDKTIALEWRDTTNLAAQLESALASGGCAAVIRNTVSGAQETFNALRDALRPRGFDVRLFHARFLFEDRQRIEREVLEFFGKGPDDAIVNAKRPLKAVLVATQVIEQSLDLDFDLMASDVAPADLVLQRAGRMHRHDRPDRPIATPTLWLFKPEGFDAVPTFGRGHDLIYDRHVLLRSFLVLRCRPTLRLPGDIDEIVGSVYDGDGIAAAPDGDWRSALAESRQNMEFENSENRKVAKQFCLKRPNDADRFVMNSRDLDDENPERPPDQQAVTRLTELTVQVVFLPHGTKWATRKRRPTVDEARGLLRRAVTLQDKRLVFALLRQAVPPGWSDSPLLRFSRLVEVDDSGAGSVGDFVVDIEGVGSDGKMIRRTR